MSPAPSEPPDPPDPRAARGDADEPPPILGAWRNLYALVAILLALEILFCGWLSTLGR
jgi:hypothetical protein